MKLKKYNVGELRKLVSESSQEFKPKFGNNVEKDNKKINDEAYKEIAKEVEKYDGGLKKDEKTKNIKYPNTDSKGVLDLNYDSISDDFKKRVKSQIKGYTSTDEEKAHKNDEFGNAHFKDIDGLEDRAKEMDDNEVSSKTNGLTSKHLDKKDVSKLHQRVYENKLTKIKFKNTNFLTESHVLSIIPDEYKVNGKKFVMEDKNSNKYFIEWSEEPKILNTTKINEQQAKIKQLFNYKRTNSNTTCHSRLDENFRIEDMLGKVRKLMN
jgi:hypothetical protein